VRVFQPARRLSSGECRWRRSAERGTLRSDAEFLRRWLEVLESLPAYNEARDEANIAMLRRLFAEVRNPAEPSD
jgi:hypothetical protein